jgi:hypothetical protein
LPPKFADGERWARYDLGGTNFALAAPGEAPAGTKGAVLAFQVEDLENAMRRLTAAGIPVDQLRDMGPHGRVATLPILPATGCSSSPAPVDDAGAACLLH